MALCYPPEVSTKKLVMLTAKYLVEHREYLHLNFQWLVWSAHEEAFGELDSGDCEIEVQK